MAAKESLVKFEFNMEFHWRCVTSYSDGQKVLLFFISPNIFLKTDFLEKQFLFNC